MPMKLNWAELRLSCRILLIWYQDVSTVGRWHCKTDRAGKIDQHLRKSKHEKIIAASRRYLVATQVAGRSKVGQFVVT